MSKQRTRKTGARKPPPRKPAARRPTPSAAPARRLPLLPIVVGGVGIIALVVLALVLFGGGKDKENTDETGETAPVTVEGAALPTFESSTDDPAIGEQAPTLSGRNFAGDEVEITDDGHPKAIFFVAHWCPHCQDEIPRLEEWRKTHELPGDVELYIVSTRVQEAPVNYPPSEWLIREDVDDIPTIADSTDRAAYSAYGAGGLPYVVFVDADNRVVLRTGGELGDDPELYTDLFEALAEGKTPVDPRTASG
jgi:thiol-disulfide isomerase/thioredoxin